MRTALFTPILLLAVAGPAATAADPTPSGTWDHETAVIRLAEDPDRALAILSLAEDPHGRLDYALALHAFAPPSPERDERIRAALASVNEAAVAEADSMEASIIGDPMAYDGSDDSLMATLRLASSTGVAQTISAFYAIPCAVLTRRPALLEATDGLFGGNRDNFLPRSGCKWGRGRIEGFPGQIIEAFFSATDLANGGYFDPRNGTAAYAHQSEYDKRIEALQFRADLAGTAPPPQARPYETWAYMSLANRDAAARIWERYDAALRELTAYFQGRGAAPEAAVAAARDGLFDIAVGGECGDAPPPPSFRKLILDRVPMEAIRAFAGTPDWRDPNHLTAFRTCAGTAGMDPLAMVAIQDVASLDFLAQLAGSLTADERTALDLEMSVNATNSLGKTPLMVAAERDLTESARWLIARGAEVDRALDAPLLNRDRRTALHYAAASGSLAMIKLLLSAGADKSAEDSLGLKPLDYLRGNERWLPANTRMPPDDLAEAARLLR